MAKLAVRISKCAVKTFVSHGRNNLFGAVSTRTSLLTAVRSITATRYLGIERWYTDKHEWITVDGKVGTVGISNYAQEALGDVVYAQLPDVGSVIKKGEECGALESVKAASELISPVSGKVIEKNELIESKPSLINTSCYKDGWLFKVELSELDEVKSLMNEESYNKFLTETDAH
ncbi:glycine cleavage system H protein [Odontomachus brunneus]|uniref:glycine cleavage system H protein n=1 Tax=Odontomachus brunneus TaxID=486640 RepID=UPI0013F25AA1|nr:glycine cleavage system H protein [Odontomachus brunneus]